MTPSERAKKLEAEVEALAAMCEGVARTQRGAMASGLSREKVSVGPETFEEFGKRLRHFLADLGPPVTGILGGTRCPECGEDLTGA